MVSESQRVSLSLNHVFSHYQVCFERQIPKGVVYATGHRGASLPTLKSAMIRWKSRGGVECVRLHHDQS